MVRWSFVPVLLQTRSWNAGKLMHEFLFRYCILICLQVPVWSRGVGLVKYRVPFQLRKFYDSVIPYAFFLSFFFLFNWCCICFLATCSNLKALQNSLAVLVSVIAVDKIKPLLSRACVWIMMLAPKVFWRPCRPHFRYNSNEDIEWLVWQ